LSAGAHRNACSVSIARSEGLYSSKSMSVVPKRHPCTQASLRSLRCSNPHKKKARPSACLAREYRHPSYFDSGLSTFPCCGDGGAYFSTAAKNVRLSFGGDTLPVRISANGSIFP